MSTQPESETPISDSKAFDMGIRMDLPIGELNREFHHSPIGHFVNVTDMRELERVANELAKSLKVVQQIDLTETPTIRKQVNGALAAFEKLKATK